MTTSWERLQLHFSLTALDVFDVCIPRGVLRNSSDGDDWKIFLGLKFLIPGYFWAGKFGKYFVEWLDLSIGTFGGFLQLF